MALFTTTNVRAFEEAGAVKRNIKLGDKIYSGDDYVYTIQNILDNNNLFAAHRTVDVEGKNIHEFTIRLRPIEQVELIPVIHHLLQPHYEVEMAS